MAPKVDHQAITDKMLKLYVDHQIGVPKIQVFPKGRVGSFFTAFTPDLASINTRHFPCVPHDILIQHLRTTDRDFLPTDGQFVPEKRLENYIVRNLMDREDVHYDFDAALLYDLAGQAVEKLRAEAGAKNDLAIILAYHGKAIADLLYEQMQAHPAPAPVEWDVQVAHGHQILRTMVIASAEGKPRDFRQPTDDKSAIRSLAFSGFKKSLRTPVQFQSEPERRFSMLLEDAPEVLRWCKPGEGDILIYWNADSRYLPDFIAETQSDKWLCEVKAENEMDSDEVKRKAQAAMVWCKHATDYELKNGGKAWSYALIPSLQVTAQADFKTLVSRFQTR
jgi:type III restriction enzyme